MASTDLALRRARLKLSESLSAWEPAEDLAHRVVDPFSLMEALVRGSDPQGRYFANAALMRRLQWWQDDWDRKKVDGWLAALVEWGEVTIEPLGSNPYSANETFDVVVIQNRRRFARWRSRPAITKAQRLEVYTRDGRACRHCGTTEALSIDHIVPWSKGGAHATSNFQTLCLPCNIRKGNR